MANKEKTFVKSTVPFTNLEELSYFLNDLSNHANDQAKVSNINGLEVFNSWSDQAGDQASDQAGDQALQIIKSELHDKVLAVLEVLNEPKKRVEIFENLNLSNQTKNREKYLDPLVRLGWIEMTIPDKPTHQDQKYRRTIQGEFLYKLIML